MANFKAMYKCIILLALVACHGVFVIEGRKMKSTKQKKEISTPMILNYRFSFCGSDVVHKDDFRPTTPSNSLGVGHSFPLDDQADVEPKALSKPIDVRHSLTGFKDGRRPPTAPGHNLGVGHSFPLLEEDVEESKSSEVSHSITGSIDAYRPKSTGPSPPVLAMFLKTKMQNQMRRHVRTDTTRLFNIWSLMLFKDCKEHKSYCFLVACFQQSLHADWMSIVCILNFLCELSRS